MSQLNYSRLNRGKIALFIMTTSIVLMILSLLIFKKRSHDYREAVDLINLDRGQEAIDKLSFWRTVGYGPAQSITGEIYAYGWGGFGKDDQKAIYWFRKCGDCLPMMGLENGMDPAALHELYVARAYASGDGVGHPNRAESLKWLRRAAAGGQSGSNC